MHCIDKTLFSIYFSEKRFGLERRHHDSDREHPDDRRRQDSRRDRNHRQNDSLWKSRDSRADPRRDRRDSFDREKVTNGNQRVYCHEVRAVYCWKLSYSIDPLDACH